MNLNSTHADWHPGETDDWLADAIAKVRAEVAAESAAMPRQTCEDGRRRDEHTARGSFAIDDHPAPQKANTGVPAHLDAGNGYTRVRREWYLGGGYLTHDEYLDAMRQADKHGGRLTDEPIGRGAPTTLTVIHSAPPTVPRKPAPGIAKVCGYCGKAFTAKSKSAKWCGTACTAAAGRARRKAQRMEGGRG